MKSKFLKSDVKFYLFLLILFLCIAILIVVFGREDSDSKNNEYSISDYIKIVDDYNTFFFVNTNVNNFISIMGNQENDNIVGLLDRRFLSDNDIDAVVNNFKNYGNNLIFSSKNIYYKEINNNYIYYVLGEILVEELDSINVINSNFQILFLVDYSNFTMSFIPISSDSEFKKYMLDIKNISIEKNEFNTISSGGTVSNMMICSLYLSDFLDTLYNNIDNSYNLLSNDMKLEFLSIDNYKSFINDNLSKLSYNIDECSIEETSLRKYYVKDVNNNEYIFTENTIMNYNVDINLNDSNE